MIQIVPLTGVVMVTTPQAVALADAFKAATMFQMMPTKVPLLGVVENMAWFTPEELPENRYPIFGEGGGKKMAEELHVPFLGELPLFMQIRKGGDTGIPAVLDSENRSRKYLMDIAERVAQQVAIINAQKAALANA
jgi:ATP-binding protein involved in chromosome partitioning